MNTNFHSNGKLLLTGEYVVLDGAKALAIPTKYGQSMTVSEGNNGVISWKSVNEKGATWFEENFLITKNRKLQKSTDDPVATRLEEILNAANNLNPKFLTEKMGFQITSTLDFPQNWGLGSSSTLINNIAEWFQIDAYQLLAATFGGSGYDIACAKTNHPISYQLTEKSRVVSEENFDPIFKNQLFFVHLNRKQNSRAAIAHYKKQPKDQLETTIRAISQITDELIACQQIATFETLLMKHEMLISSLIGIVPVKKRLFPDYPFAIKSLGAWGGDFILAVGGKNEKEYFRIKGFETILDYEEMVCGSI